MKKLLLIIALTTLCCSCMQDYEEQIFCTVNLEAKVSDGTEFVSIVIDNSVKGNFFQNLNTGEVYELPTFINNACTMKILKGVYIFAFDGTALMSDGTQKTVRCSAHRSPNDSVNLVKDTETLEFEIMVL